MGGDGGRWGEMGGGEGGDPWRSRKNIAPFAPRTLKFRCLTLQRERQKAPPAMRAGWKSSKKTSKMRSSIRSECSILRFFQERPAYCKIPNR